MHFMEPHERLKTARESAGFEDATEAARSMGVKPPTYLGHENGNRGFKGNAPKYARKYGVSLEWLLIEKGDMRPKKRADFPARTVPLIGYVSAGSAYFEPAGLGDVDPPESATEETVAVEIRGDSLGELFDRWLVFYDDVRRPVTTDLIGRLCVVGLSDGRVVIKKVKRSKARGLFHLISQVGDDILDVEVEWAARVKSMVPR